MYPDGGVVGLGKLSRLPRSGASHGVDWGCVLGFLRLVLNWKRGPKIRDVVSYDSSPSHFEPIGTEVLISLPGLLLHVAVQLPPSLTSSRLASWAGYCK